MKFITIIASATIGMHTNNYLVMTTCLLIVGFFMYKEFKTN